MANIFKTIGDSLIGGITGFLGGGPVGAVKGIGTGLLTGAAGGLTDDDGSESATDSRATLLQNLATTGLSYLGSERAREDLAEARTYTEDAYSAALQAMAGLPVTQAYSPGAASAYAARQALLGLGPEPSQDQKDAFRRYFRSAGYRDALRTGQQAITGSRAAAGLLGSGQTGRALMKYGQSLGRQAFGDYIGQLERQIPYGIRGDEITSSGLLGKAGAQAHVASPLAELRSQYGMMPFGTAASGLGELFGQREGSRLGRKPTTAGAGSGLDGGQSSSNMAEPPIPRIRPPDLDPSRPIDLNPPLPPIPRIRPPDLGSRSRKRVSGGNPFPPIY